jgi:hypothetical protein
LLKSVELGAPKPREFGIEVNTEWAKILQSSVRTAAAEVIIRGLVQIQKRLPRDCFLRRRPRKTTTTTMRSVAKKCKVKTKKMRKAKRSNMNYKKTKLMQNTHLTCKRKHKTSNHSMVVA